MFKKQLPVEKQPAADTDDALFISLQNSKKQKKRRIILTVVSIVLVLAIGGLIAVNLLRRKVATRFAASKGVESYTAAFGSVSTTVSGSGPLQDVNLEEITLPAGIEIETVKVSAGDKINEGDLLATVNLSTVMAAMAELQDTLDSYDKQLAAAADDAVSTYVKAGVAGRVKAIYAEKGTKVTDTMANQGALMLISTDGYMSLRLETDALTVGTIVTVTRENGKAISGSVSEVRGGEAVILVTDNGPEPGEVVTVTAADGTGIGSGALEIHSPLAVTGFAGTVSAVRVSLNAAVSASTKVITLTDTTYSANYDAILRERKETEEDLMELLAMYRAGALYAPISGSVNAIAVEDGDTLEEETAVFTLSPDKEVSVTISIDESDILALKIGQAAAVEITSVSEDSFTGTVTEIDTNAVDSSGVTYYTATVTLEKAAGMLPGMTARADIRIEGVENTIVIPVEALHQTANFAYVYTSYNEETKEYGNPVEVIAGLQNSSYVEITSGLKPGDVVYYQEAATFGFGNYGSSTSGSGGGRGSGGGMPSGSGTRSSGGMPSGGMPSGSRPSGGYGGRS